MKIVFVIIGTIIGAGFASGQEMYSFFVKYGINGFFGIVISTLLMILIIYKTLKLIKSSNINTYNEFLERLLGDKLSKNVILKNSILNIVNIFLLISFYVMIAGFSTYFYQELNLPKIVGAIFIIVFLLLTFSKNINGIVKANYYMIPIIIILFIILGIKKIETIQTVAFSNKYNWIISSVIYSSYNCIVLIPILINLKKYISNEKKISIISGIFIFILKVIIYLILLSNLDSIKNIEIPIVYIASSLGNKYKIVYGIVILIAIFTSAVSAGYGFLINVSKNKKVYNTISLLICLSSLFIIYIGFSNLVNLLYPLFGFLGLIQIFLTLIRKPF